MNINKISDILEYQSQTFSLDKAVTGKREDKSTYSYSTEELRQMVNRFSTGLLKRGLKKGDKISLISYNNRPEWNISDLGMLQIGVINVSVYPNISPEDYIYIFNNAKVKYCIVGYGDLLEKVLKAQPYVNSLEKIFTFDEPAICKDINGNTIESWNSLLEKEVNMKLLEDAANCVYPEDLATIIYTSGTTGVPKGVTLSNRNIVSNVKAISETMLLEKGDRALSYLPICHGFERTFVYCYLYKSIEVYYALNMETVGESLNEIHPHIITVVPRVLEKFYEKIIFSVQKSGRFRRALFYWAERISSEFDFNKKFSLWYRIKIRIAGILVYSKIKQKFGGSLKVAGTGASACPTKLIKFFCTAGIPVREGYGLTETSAVLSVNHIPSSQAMLGTVGIVLPNFDVKISDCEGIYQNGEGEILVRGESLTKGYYNDPVSTAEAFNEDGWLLTGDIGKLVKNDFGYEFIKLTDRKKELLKSSNGKYLSPAAIENRLKENFFISQVMALGEQRKFVSALIVPEFNILRDWFLKSDKDNKDDKEIINLSSVREKFQNIVDEANKHLSRHEQIRKFVLLHRSWGVETGELTPTLKLKRKNIEKKYAYLIEQMYHTGIPGS